MRLLETTPMHGVLYRIEECMPFSPLAKMFSPSIVLVCLSLIHVNNVLSIVFLQQPETQHVMVGSNATFFCEAAALNIDWCAHFPNGTTKKLIRGTKNVNFQDGRDNTLGVVNVTLIINTLHSWNNTILECVAHHGGGILRSNNATLILYMSLRPLSPSHLWITTVNISALTVNWVPDYLWRGYPVGHYNVKIMNTETMMPTTVFNSTVPESTMSYVLYYHSNNSRHCTEFSFSVSAVSRYGESDPKSIIGGFDEDPNECFIKNTMVYFKMDGTPLADLEIQLPTSVCPYQRVNYTIVIREQSTEQTIVLGPFSHRGSGTVTQTITSGLTSDQYYSAMVTVNTTVGSSDASTLFDTRLQSPSGMSWTPGHGVTNGGESDVIYYKVAMGIALGVALMTILILIIVTACVCAYCQRKTTAQDLNDSTTRVSSAMVDNPIYDGPVYESVESPLEMTPGTSQQTTSVEDMSGSTNHNGWAHTTTSSHPPSNSLGTPRYVDQPKDYQHSQQFPSKKYSSSVHTPASHNAASDLLYDSDFSSEPKRVMALKRSGQQGSSLPGTVELRSEQTMCVNPTVYLSELEESYTVMSPAGTLSCSTIV